MDLICNLQLMEKTLLKKVPDEDRIYFIAKPFVEYGNANGKTFTEEEQNALCSSDSDDSSSEE